MCLRKLFGLVAVAGLLVMAGMIGVEALFADDGVSVTRSEESENGLVSGDVNADQKVDLGDVISVLRLMTGLDAGPISPGGGYGCRRPHLHQRSIVHAPDDHSRLCLSPTLHR